MKLCMRAQYNFGTNSDTTFGNYGYNLQTDNVNNKLLAKQNSEASLVDLPFSPLSHWPKTPSCQRPEIGMHW